MLTASLPCICSLHSGEGTQACMGSAGKETGQLGGDNQKGEVASCNEKPQLGLGCHAEKTYIKESAVRLLGKSWHERGELLQQWKTRAEQVQTARNRTLYRALALHMRKGRLVGTEERHRGGPRTELAITQMRWFPWPSFSAYIRFAASTNHLVRVLDINHDLQDVWQFRRSKV